MDNPKVSIIVPVYNTEKYLKRCLDSLVNQTLKDIEIILVDDGSPDNSPKMCDEAAEKDSRIRVCHKQNAGLGMARNSGMELAKGEYIGFIDSDDYVELNMFEELYCAAKKHDADIVLSGMSYVGGNMFGESNDFSKQFFDKETVFEGEDEIKALELGAIGSEPEDPEDTKYGMSVCKNIFRRETVEKHNVKFMSERVVMSEDAIFMVDYIMHIKKAVGLPKAFYCYCRNGDSLTKSYRDDRFERSMNFMKELEKHISVNISKDVYQIYLDRLTQAFGRVVCSQEIVHAIEEKQSFSVLKERLKKICTSEKIVDVLKHYPWYKLPVKHAVFAFAIKYKLYRLQKLLVSVRNG